MGFADGFIRAHREGAQQAREKEDRELEKLMLQHRLRQLAIDEKVKTRDLAKQNFDILQGQPEADLPHAPVSQQEGAQAIGQFGIGLATGRPDMMQQGQQGMQPRIAPQTIPGVSELGISDVSVRPQSREQMTSAAAAAKLREMQMAALGESMKPFNTPAGATHTDPMHGTQFTAPKEESEPASPFAAVRQQKERELGRVLSSIELIKLSDQLDQNPSRATLNDLRTEMTRLQVEQLKQATQSGQLNPIQFAQANKLADDFSASPQTKDFFQRRQSYQTVLAAAKDPSAAGDISLIFAYMKMLDPGSVVREGEFATAQNAAGVPDRIRNTWNKALEGTRLGPAQRTDFLNQAKKIYDGSKAGFTGIKQIFDARAAQQKLDPKMVTFELPDPSSDAGGGVDLPPASHFAGKPSGPYDVPRADGSGSVRVIWDAATKTVKGG